MSAVIIKEDDLCSIVGNVVQKVMGKELTLDYVLIDVNLLTAELIA